MAQILRGDIFWADLDPTQGHEQSGQRPVLVLSNEIFNQRSGTVIAMALTANRNARVAYSSYVDNRPLSVANQPETRTDTASYALHDAEIDLVSDAVSVVCRP